MPSELHIAYCINKTYFKPSIVSATSAAYNLASNYKLIIHIIYENNFDFNLEKYASFFKNNFQADLNFYNLKKENILSSFLSISNCYKNPRLKNLANCARLFISEILKKNEKIIYLDADTIVNGNLGEIWKIDITGYSAGVVIEPIQRIVHCSALNMESNYYFNSGILYLNLKKMRETYFMEKIICSFNKIKKNLIHINQDILNVILENDVLFLPPKYNYLNFAGSFPLDKYLNYTKNMGNKSPYSNREYLEAIRNPIVIHFLGEEKPWKDLNLYFNKKEKSYFFL